MNNMYTIYNFPSTKHIWNAAACGMVIVLSYVLATFSHHGAFASEIHEDMNPMIVEHPQDAYVARNEPTTLNCKAIGFPYPTIKWFQNGLPLETSSDDRRIMLPTGQLFFSRVIDRNVGNRTSDVGVYYCMATNPVTKQTAISDSAILDIAVSPTISLIPRSTVVGRGRKISFRCQVTGNPTPAIFWSKENNQAEVSLFSDHDAERFSVSEDGTLVIGSAKKEDSGDYICKAFSKAGVAFARTTLEVKDTNTFHPPIILRGPHNLTLPVGSKALFHCLATGDPAPVINWYRNGKLISLTNHRFTILESGHLQIADVRKTDSGSYTCKASNNNGQVSWSASLSVESDNSLPKKPATLPGIFSFVPPKPVASLATETSVQLSWKGSGFPDSEESRDFKYFVEYSSPESNEVGLNLVTWIDVG